jgi:hypothetical protein
MWAMDGLHQEKCGSLSVQISETSCGTRSPGSEGTAAPQSTTVSFESGGLSEGATRLEATATVKNEPITQVFLSRHFAYFAVKK